MDRQGPSLRGVLAVSVMYALAIAAIFATYSRISPTLMYSVSHNGIAGGASRVLTFSNFSLSFGALAVLGFVVARLTSGASARARRAVLVLATAATLLCLVTALPGVVNQRDLDARPINAVPALGVLLVIGLTVTSLRTRGLGDPSPWTRADRVRLTAIVVLAIVALPWILADLGVYVADIPPLGHVFMSKQHPAIDPALAAVHLGHHHGLDGALLAIAALILGPELGRVGQRWLRGILSWYLPLMVAYGVANMINDAWYEQVVKRGWTEWRIPDMLRPHLSVGWGLILLAVVILRFLVFRPATAGAVTALGSAHDGKGLRPTGAAT
jgi:hypothetical protein